MEIIDHLADLSDHLAHLSAPKVLVPTMGALHEGHLALIRRAKELAGKDGSVIVSIFVNPTQFDKKEDLTNYPRTLKDDLEHCRREGVDLVFAPLPDEIYLPDHSIQVAETSLTQQLCGATRPGHFDGVCTIVLKLFNLTHADIAVFGKKDYQQLAVIRRMVLDLHIPITIEGLDTVRETSGLALSSRNTRLSVEQRHDAARIRKALLAAKTSYDNGECSAEKLLTIAKNEIEASELEAKIDYLELLDSTSLQPLETVDSTAVIATAVFYGNVRLIDNIEIGS